MLVSTIFRTLSPAGSRGKLSVFIFHRVLARRDPLLPDEPDVAEFEWMVRAISRSFSVISLVDAVGRLTEGTLPAAAAAITFDDGYADNLTQALPILRRHGVCATFFVCTGCLDGGRMWNDDVIEAVRVAPAGDLDIRDCGLGLHHVSDTQSRLACYRTILRELKYFPLGERGQVSREIASRCGLGTVSDLMLTTEQLRQLQQSGGEIGGHTHLHPILESMPDADAERDIAEGRDRLQSLLGTPLSLFAYPNGVPGRDYSQRHARMVQRLGFKAAFSTAKGTAARGTDLFEVPRFTPWDRSPGRFTLRCAANLLGR